MRRKKRITGPVLAAAIMVVSLSLGTTATWSSEPGDDVPWDKIYHHTAESFVTISYHLKKSDRPLKSDRGGYRYGRNDVPQLMLSKSTIEMFGVIISSKGEVLTIDENPCPPDTIASITVTGPDDVVMPAEPDRLLLKAPCKVLRILGELPATWQALEFAELGEVTPNTKLYAATITADEENHIHIRPCEYSSSWRGGAQGDACLRISDVRWVGVICNRQGQPVGLTSRGEISLGPTGFAWRGKDILADAGVSAEQQKKLEEQLEQDFAKNIYEITITFRPEPKEEEEFDFGGGFSYGRYRSGGSSSKELLLYGLSFADNKLLIPRLLSREQVEGIDTIVVKVDDKKIPASFGGVLKQCSVTVVELQEGRLPQAIAFSPNGKIVQTEPFWAVFVHELAGMEVLVEYTRWIDKVQGYADKWYPTSQRSIPLNSWLLDRQGRLIGFYGNARHEHDRLVPYLLGKDYRRRISYTSSSGEISRSTTSRRRYSYGSDYRLFEADELAQILDNLPNNYDEHIRHLSKDEQKRRVWLGVEYTQLSKEMVKQMNLRDQTEDGRIGLMINRVYPGSPAAKLGLAEGDLLLEIAVEGAPWPIELVPDRRDDYELPDFDEVDIPKEFEAMGIRMPRKRPWRSRGNYLTQMLGQIGAGTHVKLSFIHEGESMERESVIEQAPRDMLSAAKYKNEKLGLIVKDLTYEVRAALHLDEDDTAVVIAQVKEGMPAALARIKRYELVRAVDGEQIDSVETFEKLIAQAQQANKASVRLTVEWMGKTRLADVKFEAKEPSDVLRSLVPGL